MSEEKMNLIDELNALWVTKELHLENEPSGPYNIDLIDEFSWITDLSISDPQSKLFFQDEIGNITPILVYNDEIKVLQDYIKTQVFDSPPLQWILKTTSPGFDGMLQEVHVLKGDNEGVELFISETGDSWIEDDLGRSIIPDKETKILIKTRIHQLKNMPPSKRNIIINNFVPKKDL